MDVVSLLVEKGAYLNPKRDDGRTGLWMAAQNGHTGVVKFLVENGAETDIKAMDGSIALMAAAQNGHSEIVKYLCEWGSDINAVADVNDTPYTALTLAERNGWKDIVGVLESIGTEQ